LNVEELDRREFARLEAQAKLDGAKTQRERNKLGQFATPAALASDVLRYANVLLPPDLKIRFLDPAFGTGSFYSALLRVFAKGRVAAAAGYEVDPLYCEEAIRIWDGTSLKLKVADFTRTMPPSTGVEKANLLICNPPYVRHHHLGRDAKVWLQQATERAVGVKPSGLAGLYCYFLLLSHAWMAKDALAGWLVPSEFMDVGYGKKVKDYLLGQVTLLRIHRFDPTKAQFADALVSSAMVWFKHASPPASHTVEFTFGGTLLRPEVSGVVPAETLRSAAKWTTFPNALLEAKKTVPTEARLSDLFDIKRGIATGANEFFVLTPEEVRSHRLPRRFLKPILPSPRYLPTDEVESDDRGEPLLDSKRFLLSCNLPEEVVRASYLDLWRYLQKGVENGISERYLSRHRHPWYSQEHRPPVPILCTYMNRRGVADGKLFRFVLNHSRATAPNVYLMLYPKPVLRRALDDRPELLREVWLALSGMAPETLLGEGRVYGGGLHKIEPKELGNVPADDVLTAVPQLSAELSHPAAPALFAADWGNLGEDAAWSHQQRGL